MAHLRRGIVFLAVSGLTLSCAQPPTEVGFQPPERIVDLSPVITPGAPLEWWGHATLSGFGFPDSTEFEDFVTDAPPLYFKNTMVSLMDHVGPHADSPGHAIRGGMEIQDMPLEKFFGPAVVLDFTDRTDDEALEISDFQNAGIEPGDIVIAVVSYDPPQGPDGLPSYPYLSGEAARYLAGIPIRAFATDMPSLGSFRLYGALMEESLEPEHVAPEHIAFLSQEIPIIEGLVNAEQLIGEDQVVFVGFPLRLENVTGGLIRAAALVY
jgi:arylformamidase